MIHLADPEDRFVRRKRDRRRLNGRRLSGQEEIDKQAVGSASCIALLVIIYVLFLYKTERVLSSVESNQDFRFHSLLFRQPNKNSNDENNSDNGELYLFFDEHLPGQGLGNIISGLLAAHLFGQEFNRTVCLQPSYKKFFDAFDYADKKLKLKCEYANWKYGGKSNHHHHDKKIHIVNFAPAPNECELQQKLQDRKHKIWYFNGNTYPRWPAVPDNFFFQFYRAKQELMDILPYEEPPSVVVHLRSPDNEQVDKREGLDDKTLKVLGETLPHDTYLVTNRVEYYQHFEDCCQWRHPQWNTIRHSAKGDLGWGEREGSDKKRSNVDQNMQMWADWYTILTAKSVYHTHSDFSISAIHWTNKKDSYSIVGVKPDGKTLDTKMESFWADGETAPLAERRIDASGTSQLRLCDPDNQNAFAVKDVKIRSGKLRGKVRRKVPLGPGTETKYRE